MKNSKEDIGAFYNALLNSVEDTKVFEKLIRMRCAELLKDPIGIPMEEVYKLYKWVTNGEEQNAN